ncbi:MAG: HlyD family efflux transporter periplasmic adaptor subunit [Cyanobacteria bacterium P01_G01_bin.38]
MLRSRCIGCSHVFLVGILGITACAPSVPPEPPVAEVVEPLQTVVALGRLSPNGEVIKLSVPNAADSRVNQILVEEGDWVEANEVIAILQGFEGRQRDLDEARKTVEYHQARLAQVTAGEAKIAEIEAQRANIERLRSQLQTETPERQAAITSAEAELRRTQQFYQRQRQLAVEGAISQSDLDLAQQDWQVAEATLQQRQAQLDNTQQTLREQIIQEEQNLARLQEVRPVDVRVVQTELERAQIAVEQRQADLADTQVRVPVAGQILRINTRVGEQVNTQQGIVELGRTDEMYAIAEVYETEITRVRQGQPATIISEYGGVDGELSGTVEHVGMQIGKRTLDSESANPATDQNERVVEVRVRIDPKDSERVAALTNMQVRVQIDVASTASSAGSP